MTLVTNSFLALSKKKKKTSIYSDSFADSNKKEKLLIDKNKITKASKNRIIY